MAETVEEMEAKIELYRQALIEGRISGSSAQFSFEALDTTKTIRDDPEAKKGIRAKAQRDYEKQLGEMLSWFRTEAPHIEQK